ncbi:hemerythrin domain-containing protein [Nitrososphaera viennensis]|uniref:Hemerythrin domain-containing protein n=2 Tax=Nitrososphaera viennensis TaxID=1034015 RepID=A0A977IEQ4_9ARCH|nr:hemerythrin domain-containing protein [Nitrososphaera viennensis]AIC14385.1 putative hemerythrin HHE cation binding domain protein [Nitrososphaera viennensis EN76]UVS69368.1 hemerythrin domain-containing protein [Nitrososphaera viennensis]
MSSTESLRNDHFLIEKMMRALNVTADLLQAGKSIPAPFLEQALDFTKNFTNVCHHGKEEDTLFPTLEKGGMPREGGPIARMLFEHEITKQLAEKMDASARAYVQTGSADQLVADIRSYTGHVSQHLTKENFRLFAMADMMLQGKAAQVGQELAKTEEAKLHSLGRTRGHYEQLVDSYDAEIRKKQA